MKATTSKVLTALALAALTAGAWAQTEVASNATPAKDPHPRLQLQLRRPVTAADVQALKDALAAQQLQIQKLTEQLQRQQEQQSLVNGAAKADTTPAQANPPQQVAALGTPAPAVQQDSAPAAAPTQRIGAGLQQADGRAAHAALPGHQHYSWWIRGRCVCPAIKSAGCGFVHAFQLVNDARRLAEPEYRNSSALAVSPKSPRSSIAAEEC